MICSVLKTNFLSLWPKASDRLNLTKQSKFLLPKDSVMINNDSSSDNMTERHKISLKFF